MSEARALGRVVLWRHDWSRVQERVRQMATQGRALHLDIGPGMLRAPFTFIGALSSVEAIKDWIKNGFRDLP